MEPDHRVPHVTLVVPVRNEQTGIEACLRSLLRQDYERDRLEIIVADGRSEDDTKELVRRMAADDSRIRLIDNPDRTMPAGLNLGIAAASGDVIGVISGHSEVGRDYVRRAVDQLRTTGAWSVGGAIERVGDSELQRAIGVATGSRIGVGNAVHNYARQAGWVESVFPGMWPKFVFETIGTFDPAMSSNEDNELSLRIRLAGGRIWYDPSIRVRYWPRASLSGLFTQYRRYARGRVRVFRKHRSGIDWRHILPPVLVLWALTGWSVAFAEPAGAVLWAATLVLYIGIVAVGAIVESRGRANAAVVATAIVAMHVAYGVGILQGVADAIVQRPVRR